MAEPRRPAAPPGRTSVTVTIWGRASGHLWRARETLLAHDTQTVADRLAVEAVVTQIDLILAVVRRIHHHTGSR